MANLEAIARVRPSFREFLPLRNFVHHGEVLFFPGNLRNRAFSTDGRGFRHTSFDGQTLSLSDIVEQRRYGVVLGTSRVFGVGLPGNENAIPSLLSQRFGFPFANVALPQGNSRNLAGLLTGFLARAANPPAVVVHFSTGDFTGFAYSSTADPVFGSPNIKQVRTMAEERGGLPPPDLSLQAMLAFTTLWTRYIVQICRGNNVPVVLAHDSTFFEKSQPTDIERACELGTSQRPMEQRWFANHIMFVEQFYERRESLAERLKVPLAGPGRSNDLGFIDEFHYDEDGTRSMTDDIAGAIEPLLK